MDRNEAMLRELNLYPQWTLRAPVAPLTNDSVSPHGAPSEPVSQAPRVEEQAAPELSEVATDAAQAALQNITEINNVDASINSVETSRKTAETVFVPATTWPELKDQVRDCQRCGLRAACPQTIFGMGDEQADWLFVGDMPRADEALQGEPFAGEAGALLDNMLAAMQLTRDKNVYIANVVKCRPSDDAHPSAAEIAQCLPYLQHQIEWVQPKVIVALGKVAASNLLGEDVALDELRGVLHDYQGIPVIVTYHPAYLLRKPTAKAQTWQDLCFALDVMNEA